MKSKHRSRNKQWRHVYPYVCIGPCGRKRLTFDHARALAQLCTHCEPQIPNPNQAKLL